MKRLYRNTADQRIAGVCSGIADVLDIDPTIVRLLFFIAIFTPLPIVLFYIAAWFILPKVPHYK